ncbi:hypothetical protein [Roseibium aggregatum]|uniref:hypothetical protein n=1 Tax=Roseibium aggregatum TaxID=187304 RepID=UPI001E426B63|nr:hypothetical protein [Roseibium aggregatum]UES36708.1 hypothetical protein GFC08_01900 [Roseibium aggregatum]
MVRLGEHFRSEEASRHSEWLRHQKWFIKAQDERERREKADEKLNDAMESLVSAAIMATEEKLKAFQTKLDTYDEATVVALMENQEKLDLINAEINDLLSKAYVMEDGRRVFKSEDGSYVIDEYGETVSPDELDPMAIPDGHPSAETYAEKLENRKQLTQERQDILDFQEKVDAAREATADGEISEKELEDLDADLLDAMPDSVRNNVPGLENNQIAPVLKAEFQPTADPIKLENVRTRTFDANVPS